MSAVLVPADESTGVSKSLLGEQDRSSGEGDSRGGTECYIFYFIFLLISEFSFLIIPCVLTSHFSDKQHED